MAPTLFGFLESYSFMLVLAVLSAITIFEVYFRVILKEPSKKIFYLEIALLIAIGTGILGAYLVQNLYDFINDPAHYQWSWSLTFYGGLIIGAAVFFAVYLPWGRKHYPDGLEKVLSIGPGAIAFAHGLGRIGCFLAGCCYGVETDAWYGIQFQTTTTKVVPTNLFEAIFLFALASVLIFLAIQRHCPYTMSIYLIVYGIWRFFIEFSRGDYRGSFIPGLTPSQFWSIILVLIGIAYLLFLILYWNKRKTQHETAN